MHWSRIVWVTSKRQLLTMVPDINDSYLGFLDAMFLVFFAYSMLFSTPRLIKFTHRTLLLVINFIIQGILMILLALIMLINLSAITILPLVFILLPISQAISYGIIMINLQNIFDGCNKSLRFLNFLMSLWHSIAGFGHIIGYSMGLLLSRGAFSLNGTDKYIIHLFIEAGFLFFMAILLVFFHREKIIDLNLYHPPNDFLNHGSRDISSASNNLNLSPNISSLLSIEKPAKDCLDNSNYSRFSRESSVMTKPLQFFSSKKSQEEGSWIFKKVVKNSLSFAGVKIFYWGLLFWGAYFLNLKNPKREVWLGDMSMILYEAGQIIMAFLLSIKRLEYKRMLMIYPLAFLFAAVGLLFLFITDPTHIIYYIVFLIIGGFLGMLYITIGDVICEGLIIDADLLITLKGIRKSALGIDVLANAIIGLMVFLMNFMLDWLMMGFCGLSLVLMLYWGAVCYKEYQKKERSSEGSSGNINNSQL